ncbi:MAG: hypothetical protein CMM28_03185 [Rhodospirillaceae bacterium]|nr:hypothetical protein [Rhodospirillaceae bacterium]
MSATSTICCPFCGHITPLDYVHGHAQCIICKTNIAPCCDGASCEAIGEHTQNRKGVNFSAKETLDV